MLRKDYIGHLLGVASKALSRKATSRVRKFGITIQQFGVLKTLYAEDRLTSHELVKRLKTDSSSMMSLVDQLEKKGFITREPGVEDRRIKHLALTEKALSVRDALVREVNDFDQELTRQISAEEKKILIKALQKILQHTLET